MKYQDICVRHVHTNIVVSIVMSYFTSKAHSEEYISKKTSELPLYMLPSRMLSLILIAHQEVAKRWAWVRPGAKKVGDLCRVG